MKLRLDHQSVRLRLRRSDIDVLRQTGSIQTCVFFPIGQLTYQLTLLPEIDAIHVSMEAGVIHVNIPQNLGQTWIGTQQVGIYATLEVGAKKNLDIIIEKDFPCQHGSDADNADTFSDLQNS